MRLRPYLSTQRISFTPTPSRQQQNSPCEVAVGSGLIPLPRGSPASPSPLAVWLVSFLLAATWKDTLDDGVGPPARIGRRPDRAGKRVHEPLKCDTSAQ